MRGLAKKTEELIAFAHELLAQFHPMTVRQLHYAIFSAAKIDYENTQADYKRLSRATTRARRVHRWGELIGHQVTDGILHDWIIDELREAERVNFWEDVAGYMDSVKMCFRRDTWQDQLNYCELWSEKATVSGSMRPIRKEWGMSLPPQRIKTADTRAAGFKKQFGTTAPTVELDALPVDELRRRVHAAIEGLIDRESWNRQVCIREVELKCIAEFVERVKTLPQLPQV